MFDILIDILFFLLTGTRRKKKEDIPPVPSPDSPAREAPKQEETRKVRTGSTASRCVKCGKPLKHMAVYVEGQTWCRSCYKTEVLHIRE